MPSPVGRTPQRCPHRAAPSADRVSSADQAQPGCRLVGGLLRTAFASDDSCATDAAEPVAAAVCEACCEHFDPTEADLNPVVASVLLAACDRELAACGDDASRDRVHALQRRAEASIPVLLPEDATQPPQWLGRERLSLDQLAAKLPPLRSGGQPLDWAVGVTTAPRRRPTLATTLGSLAAAGWERPHLFVDGDPELPPEAGTLPRTHRQPAVGAWPNYLLALTELMHRHPAADAFLLVQDDALLPNAPVRAYLDGMLGDGSAGDRFADRFEAVSLYCAHDEQAADDGWAPLDQRWTLGAVAIAYSRAAARDFIASPELIARGLGGDQGGQRAGIDTAIGHWLAARGGAMLRPTPSLVEHIGETSTIWPNAPALGNRIAGRSLVSRPRGS